MQYFAMFWLGAVTALVIAAGIGQLRPPRAARSKTAK